MDGAPLRVVEACAGIGGFTLGMQLAGLPVRPVAFIERDSFACATLLARMEDGCMDAAPVFCGDVRDVASSEFSALGIDVFCAGYPCQPYSEAGDRQGDDDERAIWPELARLIAASKPAVVFLENVSAWAFRGPWRDLRDLGYTVPPPAVVSAAEMGAGHRRNRWFMLAVGDRAVYERLRPVVGNANSEGRQQHQGAESQQRRRASDAAWWSREPRVARVVHGVPYGVDRRAATGAAVVPQVVAKALVELTKE